MIIIILGADYMNAQILKKPDIVLIAAFLFLAAAFYFIFDLSPGGGGTVIIKRNGQIYAEVSLNEEIDVEIYSDGGTLSNTVRIHDKKAFMLYADCPDKRCVKHNPVDSQSYMNMIVCLPNRVTVEIKSNDKSKEFDVIIK